MATSFDDAFSPNFMQSLGQDPATSAGQDPATSAGGMLPPSDPMNFNNIDPAAFNDAQNNFFQQAQNGTPQFATDPGAAPAQAAPGDFNQGNLGQTPQMPQIPVGSGQNPVRPRLSLIDTIGRIADVLATTGGAKAQYQPYIDSRVATRQQQMNNQLDQMAKQQDITQTSVATQQNANQIIGGYARGLQAITARGGNPALAAGPLAQQMGIPQAQAQQIMQMYAQDPNSLGTLADAADAQKAGGSAKFSNTPLITVDAQGHPHVLQLNNQGGASEVQLPDGQMYSPKLMSVNTGDGVNLVNPNTGGTMHRYVKSGTPDAGSAPITDAQGNVIGYHPLPGSKDALAQQTTTDKAAAAKITAQNNYNDARAGLTTLNSTINGILHDPHLGQNLGVTGAIERHIPGTAAHGVDAQIHVATGQQMQAVLGHLRTMSSNGTLGFRPSQQELNGLQSTLGALANTKQSETDYRANAARAQELIASMVQRMDAAHANVAAGGAPGRKTLTPTYKVQNW